MKNSEDSSKEEIFVPQHLPNQGRGGTPLGIFAIGLLALLLVLGGALLLLAKTVTITPTPSSAQITPLSGLSIVRGNVIYGIAGEHILELSAEGYETQQISLQLSNETQSTYPVELVELPGQVTFALTGPDTAQLYLESELIGDVGMGPTAIDRGNYQYRIEHPKYLSAEGKIEINGYGAAQSIPVELEPNWRTTTLNSRPTAASIYHNDRLLGQTPLTVDFVPDLYVLSYQKEGYAEARQLLEIDLGAPLIADTILLEPLGGAINITSSPSDARIFIDNVYAGTSPLTYAAAADRIYAIRVEKNGYDLWSGSASVKTNSRSDVSASLIQQFGSLSINANPRAEVYVNGDRQGRAPLELNLAVNDYEIELRLPGYRSVSQMVAIKKDERQQITTTLLTEKDARYAEAQPLYRAKSGLNMVLAKPSTFKLGAPRGERGQMANEIEKTVTLKRWFYIAETEVSYNHFREFVRDMASEVPALRSVRGSNPNHPVTQIDWAIAALYCNWLSKQEGLPQAYSPQNGTLVLDPSSIGYRLPTEAEWEWSARVAGRLGQSQHKYPWGNGATVPKGAGNFADTSATSLPYRIPNYNDGFAGLAPVGSFSPNPMGIYDLGGNAAEWVHDFYGIELAMPGQTLVDPTGPQNGLDHVIKGSSWKSGNETELRYSYRTNSGSGADNIGFRIARWVH